MTVGIVVAGAACSFGIVPLLLLNCLNALMRRVPEPGLETSGRIVFWGHLSCLIAIATSLAVAVPLVIGARRAAAAGAAFAAAAAPASAPASSAAWVWSQNGFFKYQEPSGTLWVASPASSQGSIHSTPIARGPLSNANWRLKSKSNGIYYYTSPDGVTWLVSATWPVVLRPPWPTFSFVAGFAASIGVMGEIGLGLAGFILLVLVQRALSKAAKEARLSTLVAT